MTLRARPSPVISKMDLVTLERLLRPHGVLPLAPLRQRPLTLVLRGRQLGTARPLFVKVLTSSIAGVRRNFRREIDILRSLAGHPGIPPLVVAAADESLTFHACAPADGCRLEELARAPEGSDLAVLLRHGLALAHWLERLHRLGVAHRDLSPDHVFVAPGGSLTVVDFGMAKRTHDLPACERRLCEGYDRQALGMILWETICGRAIFPYRDPRLPLVLRREIDLVRGTNLPAPVRRLLIGCLATRSEFTPEGVPPYRTFDGVTDVVASMSFGHRLMP